MTENKFYIEPNKRLNELNLTAFKLSEVDFNIPINRYLKSSKEILRMAEFYQKDHQLENSYILYSKFCSLFVEKLPKHPNYKSVSSLEKKIISQNLKESFEKAEKLKEILLIHYKADQEEYNKKIFEYEKKNQRLQDGGFMYQKPSVHEDGMKKELKILEDRYENFKKEDKQNKKKELEESPTFSTSSENSGAIFSSEPRYPNSETEEQSVSTSKKPSFDRTLKPASLNKTIQTVVIPESLSNMFLSGVEGNTVDNVESCGVLLGKLKQEKWVVSQILIPQQKGSCDSCNITNDEQVASFQDEMDLVVLGWIHTHPSQTAFLSSVDLHTQWPYQKLFPEAIAIVCSPKFNEVGYFNLTDYGMSFIQQCQGQGFHQHPIDPPLFQVSIFFRK